MSQTRRRRSARPPNTVFEVDITGLSAEGRGIAHADGRTVFVDQALPGERVRMQYTRITKTVAEARAVEVLQASAQRVAAKCSVFGICGGCSLQHMASATQLDLKQNALLEQLRRIGKVAPKSVLPALTGPVWQYRHKARLGVRYVEKKAKLLIGFRERNSAYLTDTTRCEILHPAVGAKISELAACLEQLDIRQHIAQIEVAVGDAQTVLVLRNLQAMPAHDRERLQAFCAQHQLTAYLQPGKPDDLELLWPPQPAPLYYTLPEHDIRIEFAPSDFTQVNAELNRAMVAHALTLLQLQPTDVVLDLFSGLGNFSLAMARHCKQVTAVEGVREMVDKARRNGARNHIGNVEFIHADLYDTKLITAPWVERRYDKVLLDPPRSGAAEMLPYFKTMQPSRIVYVSCHPATLARDAGILVHELGYTLLQAGVMDMFPHTAHVESIAVFEKAVKREQ